MLALDFINIGNGDCILIREMEGTRQKFALMVDFGHDMSDTGRSSGRTGSQVSAGSMREISFGNWA